MTNTTKTLPTTPLARVACVCCTCVAVSGCLPSSPQFRLNTDGRQADSISPVKAEAISSTLRRLFGTPEAPKVPEGVDLREPLLQAAAVPYRQHCADCHGTSGDGIGTTAGVQNPYPRDFRMGRFKYTSTAGGAKPTRNDLDRIIRDGITDTAMPAFENLPEDEIDSLVEYIEYLGIRGETELYLMQVVIDEDEYLPLDVQSVLDECVLPAAESWSAAQRTMVAQPPQPSYTPQQLAASIARGRELYLSKRAQCVQCHGALGDGRGEQSELYGNWDKPKKGITPEQTRRLARLYRLPIQRLRPRDFTTGNFRGGNESEDLYLRIHVGIKGTPMPAGGPAPGVVGSLNPEQISDMVNYVRSLSH